MSIFFSNELIVFLFIETVLLFFSFIVIFQALEIIFKWDFTKSTALQYALEKKNYLISTIIFFILIVKIIIFPFFANVIDKLSHLIPGAMCGAGVINQNEFGTITLVLKIFLIYLFGIWIIINKEDILAKEYPFTIKKYYLFILIFLFLITEFVIEWLYFLNISTKEVVACCSVIYNNSSIDSIELNNNLLLTLFYLSYLLVSISSISKYNLISFFANLFFLFIGYFAVINFFGLYIYELPTHKCPFCMLQFEYNYIGYFLWGTLFVGVFFGISGFILEIFLRKKITYTHRFSFIFNTIFVILSSFYPISYYLKNGVLL